jgi:hypothetical protein
LNTSLDPTLVGGLVGKVPDCSDQKSQTTGSSQCLSIATVKTTGSLGFNVMLTGPQNVLASDYAYLKIKTKLLLIFSSTSFVLTGV